MAIEPIYGMYVHDEETDTDGVALFGSRETEDIRTGYGGVVYESAGGAVRGQVSSIENDLQSFDFYMFTDDDLPDAGYLGLTNGTIVNDVSGFHHSKMLKVPDGATKINLLKSGNISGGCVVAFYSGYKFSSTTFISGVNVPDASVLPVEIAIPQTAHYMAFCNRTAATFEAHISTNKISEYVNNVRSGMPLRLQAGSITSAGDISYGTTSISNYISDLTHKEDFKSIQITPKTGYQCNVAYYNNGQFVSRGSWIVSGNVLEIDNTYDCMLMFAAEATQSKTADEMLEEFDIQIICSDELQTVYNNLKEYHSKDATLFKEKVLSAGLCGKVIHYSIDDSYRALRRLITEENVYTSIFDNYIFALLKDVHDTTGALFTMNVINQIEDFDITLVPNKFAAEFQANKDWLKFAYHGIWQTMAYDDFASDYATFVNSVYYFTGTYDCIDRITRTEGFAGNRQAIQALKDNATAPIIGMLTADDTRTSYYLSAEQNSIAIGKGKYFDFDNEMVFLRSATRLDNVTSDAFIAEIESNPCYQNFVEVWYHEGLTGEPMRATLKAIGAWASENGYANYYPSAIFK